MKMEPPEEGHNQRTAALMAQLTNMSGKSLPKGKTVKPRDFLPRKPQSPQDQIAFMRKIGTQNGS